MRITLDYEMSGDKLPKDYRRGFASLIKKAIEDSNSKLYEYYYGSEYKMKPFTFGIYFPEGTKQNGEGFYVGNKFKINFSSSSAELVTYIYNGFHKIKNKGFQLFGNNVKPQRAFLYPPVEIKRENVLFKSISPLLVLTKGSQIEKIKDKSSLNMEREKPIAFPKYLLPGENGFNEGLEFSVRECAKVFLEMTEDFEFNFKIKAHKKIPIWHYNQWMSAFNCIIEIRSIPKVLQMIYDIGIGVRRSQGFGMLEVVG
jgi:CRISPR-associated endoribonuclease Cas6